MNAVRRRNIRVFSSSNGNEKSVVDGIQFFTDHRFFPTRGRFDLDVRRLDQQSLLYSRPLGTISLPPSEHTADGPPLESTSDDEMPFGHFVIRSLPPASASIHVFLTSDLPRTRTYSVSDTNSPHDTRFVSRIRSRDMRCCINGQSVMDVDFTGFEAAHIFPLGETDMWNGLNLRRVIEDDQVKEGMEMNSIQQGFLCSSTEHRMFDDYAIGINPDDNYRIYDFVCRDEDRTPHGKLFYRNPNVEQKYLPSPDLLRDHLDQCVLRHVKGAGKCDGPQRRFDPDIDLLNGGFNLSAGSWWSGSEGKRQLEAELAGRLYQSPGKRQSQSDLIG